MAKRPSGNADTRRPPATFPDWSARIILELLRAGHAVRFRAKGRSMWPAIPSGSLIEVTPCDAARLEVGEVAAYERAGSVVVHRVNEIGSDNIRFVADALPRADRRVPHAAVLGRARLLEARPLTRRLPSFAETLVLGRGLTRRLHSSVRRALGRGPRAAG